jgi:enoyl-CoA hydratase
MTYTRIRYEPPKAGVARIVLARPETHNAQDKAMLYELNAAFDEAAADNEVRVVVLAADGTHFSSGHDLRDRSTLADFEPVSCWGGFDLPGAEGWMAVEEEIYLGFCWRWRNFPKPTIAQVQGKVIAGGLMLVWVCDLIVASNDAQFSDPVVALGLNGHQ